MSFETSEEILKFSSEHGFNDVKFAFTHGKENIYFMLHQNIFLFKNMKIRQWKTSISLCIKKDEELKGDIITVENEGVVENGNDFINCKIIHSKQ